jgi:hypothetical protein
MLAYRSPESWDSNFKQRLFNKHSFAISPHLTREVCIDVVPRNEREQGMPGARCTRDLMCKIVQRNAHEHTGTVGDTPAFPAQWLYGLCRALPGDEFVLSPSSVD